MISLLWTFILFFFILYFPLNKRKPRFYWKTWLDDRLPLLPVFILPYGFFFVWMFGSFLLLSQQELFVTFTINFFILMLLSATFWYFFPNGVTRPALTSIHSFFERIVAIMFKEDGDTNGLPSGHVGYTLLVTYYLSLVYPGQWWIWVVAGLICISTVLVKQHYIIDVAVTPLFVLASVVITALIV